MKSVSVMRVLSFLLGLAVLLAAFLTLGLYSSGANFEGAPEKWWRSSVPQFENQYTWLDWHRGAGTLKPPPYDDLEKAKIIEHRIGRRQTWNKDYTFCQARYLLPDGSMKVWYAICPGRHVEMRPYRAEFVAGMIGLIGIALLAWPLLPRRKLEGPK